MTKDTVFVDTKMFDRLTVELKGFEKEVGTAAFYALDRTIQHVITQVGRIVPKEYAIKSTEVKDSFKGGIKKPSKTDLTASITSRGHTLTLAHFPHTPTKPMGKSKKYIKVQVKKTESKKYINVYPQPFVASTGAKTEDKIQFNIFRRLGKARFPIEPLRTVSIPQMISNEGISQQIQKIAQDKLEERLEHEIIRNMTSLKEKVER